MALPKLMMFLMKEALVIGDLDYGSMEVLMMGRGCVVSFLV